MEKDSDKELEQFVIDCVTERPKAFEVDGETFYVYPMTLGKTYLLQQYVTELGIDAEHLSLNLNMELLRLSKDKRDICLDIINLMTSKGYDEVFDEERAASRKEYFSEHIEDADMASLMLLFLSNDKTAAAMAYLGIEKEQQRMRKVMDAKSKGDKNNMTFGGKSVFGSLIDAACERYGWTKEYVLWGIDYPSLRMMLADKITSLYVSDEELKKVPLSARTNDTETVKATKENMNRIKNMGWK